jgi:two-component system response regulator HydG
VLLVEPNARQAAGLAAALVSAGFAVSVVRRLRAALRALADPRMACVVTELVLPDAADVAAVRSLRAARPVLPVVVVTSAGPEERVVAVMKLGAADYLVKRPDLAARLATHVADAIGQASVLDAAGGASPPPPTLRLGAQDFVARSDAMRRVVALVERGAASAVPVLIEGETGTGKDVLARALHTRGPRRAAPFLVQNCAALGETLLESELFGHVRGAFTGAERDRPGLFVEAAGGTVFLDEIGDAPPGVQAKLLRVLQHGEVKPVGADRTHPVRARIVAATNRELEHEAGAGRFRRDLYYRLAVFPLRVPPLRQRAADVVPLLETFLRRYEDEEGHRTGGFTRDALTSLCAYPWPGNVRELEHEVHRLVLTTVPGEPITARHLAARIRTGARAEPRGEPLRRILARVELAVVRQRLCEAPSKAAAARSLGITREALYQKLRRLAAAERRAG